MDINLIPKLVELGSSEDVLPEVQQKAKKALSKYPRDGCAVNLSALLQLAGADIRMIKGAGDLVDELKERQWEKISLGDQLPGDVGVTYDRGGNPGADHVYLVLEVINSDKMIIADNQEPYIHERFVSGKGKTRTEYFLRAT